MYNNMSDLQKQEILKKMYVQENKSLGQIADILHTYPNKLRRDAQRFKIKLRDKSQAQKNALNNGVHQHPTKGKQRTTETKNKIGKGVMASWDQLSPQELNKRREMSRAQWASLSDDKKQEIIKLANQAVRKSSKEGSKLEKFLLKELLKAGYLVDFHKEQVLSNSKLQLDLFIPQINIAIEVDGPSHFENIWGDQALARNTKYDQKKEGLLIGKGIKLIRIKQNGDFSQARASSLYAVLENALSNHKTITSTLTIEY